MKKLNKKGFTLVELLAVIVVLALLMVVAASSIGTALKNSKKSATKTEAQKIIRQLYQDNKSLSLTGSLTAVSAQEGTDGDTFTYKYDVAATGAINNFCLKHSDGYWVTGTIDENGKETIADPVEDKPADNSNCVD